MASNNENCRKCLKTIKGDSICCSTCNKWYHFKCFHRKKEVKCVLFKCGKCYKIIKSNQNCIECDCCKKWIHLRCSGFDINTFKS